MKLNTWSRNILIICISFSFVSLHAQAKSVITHLDVESKKNGAFLKIHTTTPINPQFVSGWTAEGGWFYITILGAISDSARVMNSNFSSPVTEIQVDNSEMSTQLAVKIDQKIENFEFYESKSPPELLVSLRFPITEIAGVLEVEKDKMETAETVTTTNEELTADSGVLMPNHYKRIKAALYVTGASLTIAGAAIEANKSEGFTWEIPTGLAMIVGTFIYDRYFHKPKKD